MYDFVVVGAGPAGSRFARQAATTGYDVVVFEQGEIGTPLACSGHVSTDIREYLSAEAYSTLQQNQIFGARFHVGGPDSAAYPFYKTEPVSNVIDRVGLDIQLAAEAREAGATIREDHTVTAVNEHDDHVSVTVSPADTTATRTVRAQMVAGCDGPTSRVRQSVGLADPEELLHGVLAFDSEADASDFVDVHLTAPTFFAWRIPRGDAGVEYGLAAPPGADVSQRFDQLKTAYDVDTERFCSGAIPVGPPKTVTSRRVFLLGDAAAQTKPFTGGGILYGMTAADCAANTIDPAAPETLAAYESAWRDELGPEIRLGKLLRRCYSLPTSLQRRGLAALSGEIAVHMDRPTSLFSREQLRQFL